MWTDQIVHQLPARWFIPVKGFIHPNWTPGVPKAVYFACFCERRFFARSSFVQAQLISLNNSGAARAQDQSVQRLDLRSHKTSRGITKGQAETHRFTGVKIHGKQRAFTLENRLSRQFHGMFTVISRYFCVHHGPLCSHQNCCVKDMLGWNRLCVVDFQGDGSTVRQADLRFQMAPKRMAPKAGNGQPN